jgi:hypothetical protein
VTERFKQRKRHYEALFNIGLVYAWDLSEIQKALPYFEKVNIEAAPAMTSLNFDEFRF